MSSTANNTEENKDNAAAAPTEENSPNKAQEGQNQEPKTEDNDKEDPNEDMDGPGTANKEGENAA